MNPLLSETELPKYDEIKAEHVGEAVQAMVKAVDGLARVRAWGATAIRGRNEPVSVFSLVSLPDEGPGRVKVG